MPSPKRRPAELRLIGGRRPGVDSGGRPVEEPPKFVRAAPDPPFWLEGEALAEWRRVTPELARLDLLKAIDSASLTAYCLAWERLVDAHAAVKRAGHLVGEEHEGYTVWKRNPALVTLENASKELRAWAGEFGLTPSAEGKVAGRRPDEGDGEAASAFA